MRSTLAACCDPQALLAAGVRLHEEYQSCSLSGSFAESSHLVRQAATAACYRTSMNGTHQKHQVLWRTSSEMHHFQASTSMATRPQILRPGLQGLAFQRERPFPHTGNRGTTPHLLMRSDSQRCKWAWVPRASLCQLWPCVLLLVTPPFSGLASIPPQPFVILSPHQLKTNMEHLATCSLALGSQPSQTTSSRIFNSSPGSTT